MSEEKTRLDDLVEVIKLSTTEVQLENRKQIYSRILKYVGRARDDDEFEDFLIKDMPAWVAWYLNDYSLRPVFLAPWQIEGCRLEDENNFVLGMTSRKVGKTLRLAARIVYELATHHLRKEEEPFRMTVFAPTKTQDFVFRDARNFIEGGYGLYDKIIAGGGTSIGERITTNLGGELRKRTVGLQSEGRQIKGERDSIAIDEIQDVKKRILTKVIFPIISDTYSVKYVWLWGTPDTTANPDFERFYRERLKDPVWGVAGPGSNLYVDWKRGVREGCTNEKIVRDIITQMHPDEADMEYRARFPVGGTRFYERSKLQACGDMSLRWESRADGKSQYGMAVDWAKIHDRTEILVAKAIGPGGNTLAYVYHKRIDPAQGIRDYSQQVSMVKKIYNLFNPVFFIYDSTGAQDTFTTMLSMPPGALNKHRFYQHKNQYGFKASGPENYNMHRNHRDMIQGRRIRVPMYEPFFSEIWIKQHYELQRHPVYSGGVNYERLVEPREGFKDFAVTCAMLSKWKERITGERAIMSVGAWGGRSDPEVLLRKEHPKSAVHSP